MSFLKVIKKITSIVLDLIYGINSMIRIVHPIKVKYFYLMFYYLFK